MHPLDDEPQRAITRLTALFPSLAAVLDAGFRVFSAGDTVAGVNEVRVRGKSGWKSVVRMLENGWYCDCEAFRFRTNAINDHPLCKHVVAALLTVCTTADQMYDRFCSLSFQRMAAIHKEGREYVR